MSGTVGKEMYYYALLLDDGTVLRVAKLMDGLVSTALSVLPVMCILAGAMLVIAWLMAKWQTARLIKPINELDLEHPLENTVYEEMTPLLEAMDRQNKDCLLYTSVQEMMRQLVSATGHQQRLASITYQRTTNKCTDHKRKDKAQEHVFP